MNSKALRAERGKLILDAQALMSASVVTAEDGAKFDAMLDSAALLMANITRIEAAAALVADLGNVVAREADATGARMLNAADTIESRKALEQRLMRAFISNDLRGLSDADRGAMQGRIDNVASVGVTTAGGFLVAPDFMRDLLAAQKAFGGMRAAARSVTTTTGVDIPWPTMDDTGNVATIVSENTTGAAGTDLAFNVRTLKAWTYRSGFLALSRELLQDTAFDFDTLIRDALAIRFARGQNAHFTSGDGTTQPQGITVGGVVGKTGVAGQTLTVIPADLVDLEHSVDPMYRPGSAYMMNDMSVRNIKKIVDSTGRPLLTPGFAVGGADTIGGYPVIVNQDLPVMAANAKSILFGNFQNYVVRDVMGLQIARLNELYAANFQVAFIAFQRTDGRLVSAAQPIKWYANSAT